MMSADVLSVDSGPLNYVILALAQAIIQAYGENEEYRDGPVSLVDTGFAIRFVYADDLSTKTWTIRKIRGNRLTVSPADALDDLITILCLAQTRNAMKE